MKGAMTQKEVRRMFAWFRRVIARRTKAKASINQIAPHEEPIKKKKKHVRKGHRLSIYLNDGMEELVNPITGEVYEIPRRSYKL
jgi:hypothetical protein